MTCMDANLICRTTGRWPGFDFSFDDWCVEDVETGLLGLSECVTYQIWKEEICGEPFCEYFTEDECYAICMGVYEDNTHAECVHDTCMWVWAACEGNTTGCDG